MRMSGRKEKPSKKVDLIFVLGNHDIRTARHAAGLYQRGVAPLILFSGGRGNHTESWEEPEAVVMARIAEEMGVPKSSILIEPKATNTGENIRFGKTLLAERGITVRSCVLVQKPYMLRRALATFEAQWEGDRVDFSVSGPDIPRFVDYPCAGIPRHVVIDALVGDTQRCTTYGLIMGFQSAQDVPEPVLVALSRLVGLGYTSHLVKLSPQQRADAVLRKHATATQSTAFLFSGVTATLRKLYGSAQDIIYGDEDKKKACPIGGADLPDVGIVGNGGGERGLTFVQHAVQASQQARKSGFSTEVQTAALLHDIGWLLPKPTERKLLTGAGGAEAKEVAETDGDDADAVFLAKHDTIGAEYLRKLGFSERIARLVEGHVQAKRYMCFKEKGYFEGLSEGSVFTLKHQGGPMVADEASRFEAEPDFKTMVLMRRWDEGAKDTSLVFPDPLNSLEGYLDMINKELKTALWSARTTGAFSPGAIQQRVNATQFQKDGFTVVTGWLTDAEKEALPSGSNNETFSDFMKTGRMAELSRWLMSASSTELAAQCVGQLGSATGQGLKIPEAIVRAAQGTKKGVVAAIALDNGSTGVKKGDAVLYKSTDLKSEQSQTTVKPVSGSPSNAMYFFYRSTV